MKNTGRTILSILLTAAVLAGLLSGCGKTGQEYEYLHFTGKKVEAVKTSEDAPEESGSEEPDTADNEPQTETDPTKTASVETVPTAVPVPPATTPAITEPAPVPVTSPQTPETVSQPESIASSEATEPETLPETTETPQVVIVTPTETEPETTEAPTTTEAPALDPITVTIGSDVPKTSQWDNTIRVNSVRLETIDNGAGAYTVKIHMNITNIGQGTRVGSAGATLYRSTTTGTSETIEPAGGYTKALPAGASGDVGVYFYNVAPGYYVARF